MDKELTNTNNNIISYQDLAGLAFGFANKSSSANTKRTYDYAWRSFNEWCICHNVSPFQIDNKESLIAFYISEQAAKETLKVSSISCYLAGIRDRYKESGIVLNLQHPAIQKVLKGIRNTLSKRPASKDPLLVEELREIVTEIPIEKDAVPYPLGIRDRAILLLGFSGAFRRSELVSLNIEDLTFTRDGFVILLRKSKTDQEGEGMEKAIPYGLHPLTCPVRALKDWLDILKVQTGPLFYPINKHGHLQSKRLSGHAIAVIIKRYCKDDVSKISGHSLRAGFVTTAAKKKVPEHLIMKQTGHKCSDTLKRYIRIGTRFDENAASLVGL